MVRFLVTTAIQLVASAVGLIVAALVLGDDFQISGTAFIIAVGIFTLATAVLQPFILKMTLRNAQALMGASALVTTFLGLLITVLLSDGLKITGAGTWLMGTLVVWLATVIAGLLIPFVLAKRGVQAARARTAN